MVHSGQRRDQVPLRRDQPSECHSRIQRVRWDQLALCHCCCLPSAGLIYFDLLPGWASLLMVAWQCCDADIFRRIRRGISNFPFLTSGRVFRARTRRYCCWRNALSCRLHYDTRWLFICFVSLACRSTAMEASRKWRHISKMIISETITVSIPENQLNFYYVSPSNEGRHIDLVWFFLLLIPLALLPLLLSEACPDHNFFVFRDSSMIFGMWCMTIGRCVAYRNDLRGTLTFDLRVK